MTALTYSWACRSCNASGTGPTSDKDAERHTKQASHATVSGAKPKEGR